MRSILFAALLASAAPPLHAGTADMDGARMPHVKPVVIGHRGASALRPEHTLASYTKAVEDGADFIEPDLVMTRDGVLVARHENDISGTTNVADKPGFASRKTTRIIDGVAITGWFTEDFTLAELKTLRARERIPANRPANVQYNDQFEVPTLQEIIELARELSARTGRVIGIYPETKHPSYFRSIGLPLERTLVDALHAAGYRGRSAPVFIQSFEVANLRELRAMTDLPLIQLLSASGAPEDFRQAGDRRGYRDLISPAGLAEISRYADGIGPAKNLVIARGVGGNLAAPTALVRDAHAAGLLVHPYTFRPENPFLPADLRRGDPRSPFERGDMAAEIRRFIEAGVDGVFVDDPAVARAAIDAATTTERK